MPAAAATARAAKMKAPRQLDMSATASPIGTPKTVESAVLPSTISSARPCMDGAAAGCVGNPSAAGPVRLEDPAGEGLRVPAAEVSLMT
jgi:hypothetical protein